MLKICGRRMETAKETSQIDVELNFEISPAGLEIIYPLILADPIALDKWQILRDALVMEEVARREIDKRDTYSEKIQKILYSWKSENGKNATLQLLVNVFRSQLLLLNALADETIKNADTIMAAPPKRHWSPPGLQLHSNGICYKIPQSAPNIQERRKELSCLHKTIFDVRKAYTAPSWPYITILHGLSGVGKTTLAIMYAHETYLEFDGNVLWVNASSTAAMRNSFTQLAEHIEKYGTSPTKKDNLSAKNFYFTRREEGALVDAVYDYFTSEKSLFIFDNVQDFIQVSKFLPNIQPGQSSPFFLITSQIHETFTKNDKVLRLDIFRKPDALAFVQMMLPGMSEDDVDTHWLLCEKLGCFPLAMHQALVLIGEQVVGPGDVNSAIVHFIGKYDEQTKMLLKDSQFLKAHTCYRRTVYTTITLTLNKIANDEHGNLAIKLLEYMAYIQRDHIDVTFLRKLAKYYGKSKTKCEDRYRWIGTAVNDLLLAQKLKHEEVVKALNLLIKYCTIYLSCYADGRQEVQIHSLVQDVIRSSLSSSKEVKILRHMMMFLDDAREKKQLAVQAKLHGLHIAKYARVILVGQFKKLKLNIDNDYQILSRIKKKLANKGEDVDLLTLMTALCDDEKINMAIVFLNNCPILLPEYNVAVKRLATRKPVSDGVKMRLKEWIKRKVSNLNESIQCGKTAHLAIHLLKYFPYLDTDISTTYLVNLVRKGGDHGGCKYEENEIRAALKILHDERLIQFKCITVDPLVRYGLGLVLDDTNLQVQTICCLHATHVLESGRNLTYREPMMQEACRHGLSMLKKWLYEETPAETPNIRNLCVMLIEHISGYYPQAVAPFGIIVQELVDKLFQKPPASEELQEWIRMLDNLFSGRSSFRRDAAGIRVYPGFADGTTKQLDELDVESLQEWLRSRGIADASLKILRDEQVDGQVLASCTSFRDLIDILPDLKTGPARKILFELRKLQPSADRVDLTELMPELSAEKVGYENPEAKAQAERASQKRYKNEEKERVLTPAT